MRKIRILESIFLQNNNWLRVQDFVYKTLRLVTISLFISAIQRGVLRFLSGKVFFKSNRKLFSCVCIAWYKHSRRWENSRWLCKPSTPCRVCITVANSPNPSRVYIRLCKHGKRFLLLKQYTFRVVQLRKYSPNSRCRPCSCPLPWLGLNRIWLIAHSRLSSEMFTLIQLTWPVVFPLSCAHWRYYHHTCLQSMILAEICVVDCVSFCVQKLSRPKIQHLAT